MDAEFEMTPLQLWICRHLR